MTYVTYTRQDSGRIVELDATSGRGIQFQPGEVIKVGDDPVNEISADFAALHVQDGNLAYCDADGNLVTESVRVEEAKTINNTGGKKREETTTETPAELVSQP